MGFNKYTKAKRKQMLRKQKEQEKKDRARKREEHKHLMKTDTAYKELHLAVIRKEREKKHNYKMANDDVFRARYEQKQQAKEEHKRNMKNDPLYAERYRIKQFIKKANNKNYTRNSIADIPLDEAKEIYRKVEDKNRRERRILERQAIKQAKKLNKEYLVEEREERKQRLMEARNKAIEGRNNLREIKKINVFSAQQERLEKRELGKQKFESNLLGDTKKKLTHLDGTEAVVHDVSDIKTTEATKKLEAKGYNKKRIEDSVNKADLEFNKAIEDGLIFGEINKDLLKDDLSEEVKKIVDNTPPNVKIKGDKVTIGVSNWDNGTFVNEEVEKTFEEFLADAKYIKEFNEEKVDNKISHADLVAIKRNDHLRDEKTYSGNGKEDAIRSKNKKITIFKTSILKSMRTSGFSNYTIYRLFEAYDAESLTILARALNEGELFDLFSSDNSFVTNSFRKAVLAMGYKLDDVFEGKTIEEILEECNA